MKCPECGNADGSNLMGHQVQGVYDGVLWWECLSCGHGWPRDFGDWTRLNEQARKYADWHNAEQKEN